MTDATQSQTTTPPESRQALAPAHGSAWRRHHKQRPTDGQLIVVSHDNKWRAGRVTKRGSYDYLNTGEGSPRMITYGAQWMPIDEPNRR